jgi:hypothetical protein
MSLHWENISTQEIEGEKWNDIPGYDGMYQASSLGRIRSVDRTDGNGRFWKGAIRRQKMSNKNRKISTLQVVLSANSKYVTYTAQQLVFTAFNGLLRYKDLKVGHKNKNLLDNRIENLEAQTQLTVIRDSIKMGNMVPNTQYGQQMANKKASIIKAQQLVL